MKVSDRSPLNFWKVDKEFIMMISEKSSAK